MPNKVLPFCIGLSFLVALPASAADAPLLGEVPTIASVKVSPEYPDYARSRGLGGWVRLSFTVTPDGDVADVIVVDSTNEVFEESAASALANWKYDPVEANVGASGIALQTIMYYSFQGGASRGSRFTSMLRKAEPLLSSGKLDEAEEAIEDLHKAVRSSENDAVYRWLATRYLAAHGDVVAAYAELSKMLMFYSQLPPDLLVAALEKGVSHALVLGKFRDAKRYIDYMKARTYVQAASAYDTVLEKMLETERTIDARLAANDRIDVPARNFRRYWGHSLIRRTFSIGDVDGELQSLQVRCKNVGARYLELQIDVSHTLPDDWRDCDVFVEAAPDTRFVLTEYPSEPVAAAPVP